MSSRHIITRFTPAFQAAIKEASRKVFDQLPIVPFRTGHKYLRSKPMGPLAVNYYLPDTERPFRNTLNGFATEEEERRKETLYRLKRRGKGPAKKGQGKRASKGKK